MKKQEELYTITSLFAHWLAEIRTNNALDFLDINKISESLSLKILNLVYDHNLTDLNEEKNNFPGLDLGDRTKDKVAFQITSRDDYNKIKENLETFVDPKYNFKKEFENGIRFLILNQNQIKIGTKNPPKSIYPNFDVEKHIIYEKDLLKEIAKLYDSDYVKFKKIKDLLEEQFKIVKIVNTNIKLNLNPEQLDYLFFTDYSLEAEEYYYIRKHNLDKLFKGILDLKNIWIYGDSGNGKSAFSKRNLIQNNIAFHYCYLSSYQSLINSDEIFEDLFSSIYNLYEEAFTDYKIINEKNLLNKVAESLNIAFKNEDIVVFFDEFFVPDLSVFKDFVNKIINLSQLYSLTNKSGKRVKFVISTINSPKNYITNYAKSCECFEFIEIEKWTNPELIELMSFIGEKTGIQLSLEEFQSVGYTTMTPRLIKETYRKAIMYDGKMTRDEIFEKLKNEKIT